jgi:hypothetical protein
MALDVETAAKESPAAEPPAPAPPEPAAEGEMTAMGTKPDVADPAIAQPAPTASEQAFNPDTGVHYWDQYKKQLQARGQDSQWDDKYMSGHTDATQFVQPYEGRYAFEWTLKKGQSASEAVQAWIKGRTIAEYRSAGVAKEIDEVRDELGDRKFDALFGSKSEDEDSKVPASQRLKISAAAYTTPIDAQMKEIAAKADAQASEKSSQTDGWQVYEREADDKAAKADDIVQQKPTAAPTVDQKV